MKNLLTIILLVISYALNAQKSKSDYYTIGSSENKVLQVQGQPSSITRIGNYSTFFYGNSSVGFTNKLVSEYYNSGNLKIIVTSSIKEPNSINKKAYASNNKKSEQVNKQVKWMYFTFISSSSSSINVDRLTGDLLQTVPEYSKIYSISNYTDKMKENLEFCLQKEYREKTGKEVFLISHVYDSREVTMILWNSEKGRIANVSLCYYLNQYGVTEH